MARLLAVLACALAVSVSLASAMDMDLSSMMGGSKPPEKVPAKMSDLPFIKCSVCEAYVKQAILAVKALRAEEKPGHKLSEVDIIDKLEKLCDVEVETGEWITRLDMQEEGDEIKLVDMGAVGECGVECRTIARACERVAEDMDLSDLSEALYKQLNRAALSQLACREQTGVCLKKPPPVPKDRTPGPAFEVVDADKLSRDRMLRKMKAAGLKGTMYDRDSIEAAAKMMGIKEDGASATAPVTLDDGEL